jgi:hypothetical protein
MLARVMAIALNTYRESVRARILLGLAGVAFAVALYSRIVGAFTLHQAPRVISDLGSASMSIFAVAVAILVSATSLHRELEQKTLFPILARPIERGEFLVGKYLGTLLTVAVFVLADGGLVLLLASGASSEISLAAIARLGAAVFVLVAALVAVVWRAPIAAARTYGTIPWAAIVAIVGAVLAGGAPDERRVILGAALLTIAEVAIVAAVATVFASFSTPFLSALFTLGVWLVGRNADTLAHMPSRFVGRFGQSFFAAVALVWPNLQVYVPPRTLLTGEAPGVDVGTYLALALVKAACWSVLMLAVASLVFRRRDFL